MIYTPSSWNHVPSCRSRYRCRTPTCRAVSLRTAPDLRMYAMASLTTVSGTPHSHQRSRTRSPLAGSLQMELSLMTTARSTRSKALTRSGKISAQGRLCAAARLPNILFVCITRDVPRPRTQPHCSVGRRWSHASAIGGCSSEVNTFDAWSAINNPRCELQSAASPFSL